MVPYLGIPPQADSMENIPLATMRPSGADECGHTQDLGGLQTSNLRPLSCGSRSPLTRALSLMSFYHPLPFDLGLPFLKGSGRETGDSWGKAATPSHMSSPSSVCPGPGTHGQLLGPLLPEKK